MAEQGFPVRDALYLGADQRWPLEPEEWERRAGETMDAGAFDYIAGGAGAESTVRANREAFARRALRPRMLTGNLERDRSVRLLGTRSPAPLMLAPVGVLEIAHIEAELAVARAAAATAIPMMVSSQASSSMEDVAAQMGSTPRWFQLYWVNDREVVGSLVDRAAEAGYEAIVVTLDTLTLGWRDRDLRRAYLPFIDGRGIAQFTSDPVFRSRLAVPPEDDPRAAGIAWLGMFSNLALTWADIAWLRERTELPLLVKGVLRADDAALARSAGVDGVIVSNHGGRQVDGAIAALDALPEVREELGPGATVLMDGGIRRGPDVVKALALGADAVLLGRPYAYGLAVGGEEGVKRVIDLLLGELDVTLALVGAHSVSELDASFVTG